MLDQKIEESIKLVFQKELKEKFIIEPEEFLDDK